ncbi:hypothetical protein ACM66B_002233 [Microbotryomycetes sp. NB124-2]
MASFTTFLSEQLLGRPKPTTHKFDGRVAIVTGANTGLGLHTAIHLARMNPKKLILACRNLEKGQKAKQTLLDSEGVNVNQDRVEVWHLDLASLQSVKEFADKALHELDRLDLLVESAGLMTYQFVKTEDGYETTLQVNGIATALLGVMLLPLIKKTAKMQHQDPACASFQPHLTVVGSEVHAWSPWKGYAKGSLLDNLNQIETFNKEGGTERYHISKIFSIFIARKLAESAKGSDVVVNVVNPGLVVSEFKREMSWLRATMLDKLSRTTSDGARYILWACLEDTSNEPGAYVSNCEVKAPSAFVQSAEGKQAQDRVWEEMKQVWLERVPEVKKSLETLSRA